MTNRDFQFMKEMGIEPSGLDDPFLRPLQPPPSPEAPMPNLTEDDARWLQNLGVPWEQDPELGFVPPKSLREYLVRYPNCIREATERAAKELEADLPNYYDLDDLAQDIVVMFLEFSEDDLEDMYPLHPPMRPGGSRSAQFHDYIRHRVRAALRTLLKDRAPRPGDFR
jgi:hypothetical protein